MIWTDFNWKCRLYWALNLLFHLKCFYWLITTIEWSQFKKPIYSCEKGVWWLLLKKWRIKKRLESLVLNHNWSDHCDSRFNANHVLPSNPGFTIKITRQVRGWKAGCQLISRDRYFIHNRPIKVILTDSLCESIFFHINFLSTLANTISNLPDNGS